MKWIWLVIVWLWQCTLSTVTGFVVRLRRQTANPLFSFSNDESTPVTSVDDGDGNGNSNHNKDLGGDGEKSRLALLTFDLDDTLFPCAKVVEEANQAMVDALHDAGFPEATNDRIVQHTKNVRRKQMKAMTYTDMRKRAILTEIDIWSKERGDYSELAERIYGVWLAERHASAERHLFDGTIEMLQTIQARHPGVCIAAITNGRGNPLDMRDTVSEFFDFCVSGEDDNVFPERKPHRGIFKVSLAEYHKRYPHAVPSDRNVWCHVGDCLGNDVGGSANNGAYAIWADLDELRPTGVSKSNKPPSYSTASPSQNKNRQKLKDAGRRRVSERITSLRQLPEAVDSILNKAYARSLLAPPGTAAAVKSKPSRRFGSRR